jgi:hypothetical protein
MGTDGQPMACVADFAKRDCSVSALQVLKLVAEVMSPEALQLVRWQLHPSDGQSSGKDSCLPILEYLESELVFAEFVRLFLQLADLVTHRDADLCTRLSLPKRFEGYLRYVLFPAFRNRYKPPEAEENTDGKLLKQADLDFWRGFDCVPGATVTVGRQWVAKYDQEVKEFC